MRGRWDNRERNEIREIVIAVGSMQEQVWRDDRLAKEWGQRNKVNLLKRLNSFAPIPLPISHVELVVSNGNKPNIQIMSFARVVATVRISISVCVFGVFRG